MIMLELCTYIAHNVHRLYLQRRKFAWYCLHASRTSNINDFGRLSALHLPRDRRAMVHHHMHSLPPLPHMPNQLQTGHSLSDLVTQILTGLMYANSLMRGWKAEHSPRKHQTWP